MQQVVLKSSVNISVKLEETKRSRNIMQKNEVVHDRLQNFVEKFSPQKYDYFLILTKKTRNGYLYYDLLQNGCQTWLTAVQDYISN